VALGWLPALVLALGFLAADTGRRLEAIAAVSGLRPSDATPPSPDPSSATGFAAGRHRLILPTAGVDGYHWLLQTERMLAGGGLRIRHTPLDNAPEGREVHWSSPPRWWLAFLARVRGAARPDLSPALALESVAAAAGAVALAAFLLLATPLLAWHFGSLAASVFALAWVAVFPLYETSMAGIVDHHGFAAMLAFLGLILLVAGGAGLVREEPAASSGGGGAGRERGESKDEAGPPGGPQAGRSAEAPAGTRLRIPEAHQARRWFVAAGVAGGMGLWISAATTIPVLVATGFGALLAAGGAASRGPEGAGRPRIRPGLWRVWGATGCATALVAYGIEYAPDHLGLRLEVNHPLYALAWLGGGNLLALACRAVARKREPVPGGRTEWRRAAWSALLLAAPAAVILVTGEATFRLADPVLGAFHAGAIREFQGLATHIAGLSALQTLQSVSALPLVLLPAGAVIALGSGRWAGAMLPGSDAAAESHSRAEGARPFPRARLVLAAVTAGAGLAFFHVAARSSARALLDAAGLLPNGSVAAAVAIHAVRLGLDAAVFGLLFLWPLWRSAVTRPADPAGLALAAAPAAVLLGLAFWQVRWLPTAMAALLAVLVTAAGLRSGPATAPALSEREGFEIESTRRPLRTFTERIAAWAFPALVLLPFPLSTAWFPWRHGYSGREEAAQVVARDVAYRLRTEAGTREVVAAAPPVTTTWLLWFGGFRGLGTLYWENAEGLAAAAALVFAADEAGALAAADRHGVTHIVLPSWEPIGGGPPRLGADAAAPDGGVPGATPAEPWLARATASGSLPDWLVPVPYATPALPALRGLTVRVLEVRL
jgi:hypothetical protein